MGKLNQTILLRIKPETKITLRRIAKAEHYSMTGLILLLIDKKIEELNNDVKDM